MGACGYFEGRYTVCSGRIYFCAGPHFQPCARPISDKQASSCRNVKPSLQKEESYFLRCCVLPFNYHGFQMFHNESTLPSTDLICCSISCLITFHVIACFIICLLHFDIDTPIWSHIPAGIHVPDDFVTCILHIVMHRS